MEKSKFKHIKTIFWDWNGTLLDDVHICIDTMNSLLKNRNISLLDLERYREIFTFPVKEYYLKAGFNFTKEDFDIPATEFIEKYNRRVKEALAFANAESVLRFFAEKKFMQYILSAMKKPQLLDSVKHLKLDHYFAEIQGINDHYAHGKDWLAASMIENLKLEPQEICLIGDTLHDHEIAEANQLACILVSTGHQSKKRLQSTGRIVIDDIKEIKNIFSE